MNKKFYNNIKNGKYSKTKPNPNRKKIWIFK